MAVVVESVPESIGRAEIVDLLAHLGIDASNTRSVHFGRERIDIEVYALNGDGHRFATGNQQHLAVNRIVIPITD